MIDTNRYKPIDNFDSVWTCTKCKRATIQPHKHTPGCIGRAWTWLLWRS